MLGDDCMNVISLHYQNPDDLILASETIKENIKQDPIFIVTGSINLCDFIDKLDISGNEQFRMQICKEMEINVLLNDSGEKKKFGLLSEMLKEIELDDSDKEYEIVVLGDYNASKETVNEVRCQLCGIIQQLLYINISLSRVHVCTEKEARDNEKVRKFQDNIKKHKEAICESIKRVEEFNGDVKGHKGFILESLKRIQGYIDETQENELTIAVAASKKSGKSVIVNSMIECELAPTSLELATPNNCIYRKSNDSDYHLKYNGKGYKSSDSKTLRKKVLEFFKKAETDVKGGLGIPDMELWYPSDRNSFSNYTIYDTPGPDLAGATGHKEAAERGVKAADVIVFTIDYSKYLTDSEYSYLQNVIQFCRENQKNYSLILNVNKLDERYNNGGNNNGVRIVDFIRNRLIELGKTEGMDLRNCVVIGTSALTYYNALAAPNLSCTLDEDNCSVLLSDFSTETIDECIESIDSSVSIEEEASAKSILNQLYEMTRKAKVYHKKKIASIEEMKEFSGMPNFLSYVDYIGTQKARSEKVNVLLSKIDGEYSEIMNRFHLEELFQKLSENKDLLEKAKKILRDFNQAVNEILDPDYKDLYGECYAKIYDENENMQSEYLKYLTKKIPIEFNDVSKCFGAEVNEQLSFESVISEVTNNEIETSVTRKLGNEYGSDENQLLKINEASNNYQIFLSRACVECLNKYIDERKEELGIKLESEQNSISSTFTFVWEQRKEKLRETVKIFSDKLEKECSEKLNIEIPVFQTALNGSVTPHKMIPVNVNALESTIKKEMEKLNHYNDGITTGMIGFFRRVFRTKDKITLGNVLRIYSEAKLAVDIKGVYEKNGTLANYLDDVCTSMKNDMNKFVDDMNADISILNTNLYSSVNQIEKMIDETGKYEKEVSELEQKKESLEKLKVTIAPFSYSWNEVITS